MKSKKIKALAVTALLSLAFCLIINFMVSTLPKVSYAAVGANGNYYYTDYETKAEALQAGDDLNKEIIGEGITLLKNENSLPLKSEAKVSVFGKRSVNLLYGGQGSGSGGGGVTLSLQESLSRAGIQTNPALTEFYKDNSRSGDFNGPLISYQINAGSAIKETPASRYTADLESTYDEYSDAALIVISRFGGEAVDLPKSMSTGFNSDGSLKTTAVDGARSYLDHYLQLDQNETDLINYVGERFDNVIIVLNTPSQFECGFLDDPGHYAYNQNIKGALWIGYPGTKNGFESFGKILSGEINPSGHTVDTYARDFTKDPTWENLLTHNNKIHYYNNGSYKPNYNYTFVDYEEGIYVGYRYYETRGFTEGNDAYTGELLGTTTTQWNSWYDAHVVYPFGYGLSYTQFKWEFVESVPAESSVLSEDGNISMKVKVTNVGERAGKDVVQMYYTAPYTPGGIEKSHVTLGNFAKTDLLAPGESQILTITMSVKSMSSYDYSDANGNGFKGYELDGGEYVVRLMRNAHESVIDKSFLIPDEGFTYREDEKTGTEVVNRFDDVSYKVKTYLSRSNWEGTFPAAPTEEDRLMTEEIYEQTIVDDYKTDDPLDPWYTEEMPDQKSGTEDVGDVKLADLYGLDYDDPLWDQFMNQFTVGDGKTGNSGLTRFLIEGECHLMEYPGLGIPFSIQIDGPSGINDRKGGDYTLFANEVCTASTWNKELAYRKGIAMGNEALFGGINNGVKQITGLYAPAVNLHRSPFGGRNYEYFSEDGLLSGMMAAEIIKGCNEKGLLTFLKHFAVNEQETSRDLIHTWASEQSMREIYFKPFELAVKEGNTHGIMSSLNFIGGTWAGGNYNLITEVLRNEWGFEGAVVTDFVTNRWQLNYDQCIRAGGDLLLTYPSARSFSDVSTPTSVSCLRRAVKNACYTLVNFSNVLNVNAECIMGVFNGKSLAPSPVYAEYNGSVATATLNSGGNSEDITYSLKEGSTLPEGLSLNSDGSISGTPTEQVNDHAFTVIARYGTAKKESVFTISITDPDGSIIYSGNGNLGNAYKGESYSASVATATTSVGEGQVVITYSLGDTSILPEGLTLSSDGTISGVPSKIAPDYSFEVVASAEGFADVSKTFRISVLDSMEFDVEEIPSAKFGQSYAADISNGIAGAKYALKDGSTLPDGLTLTEGGIITGKPTKVVTDHSFTVVVSAEGYEDVEKTLSMSVGINYPKFELDDAQAGESYYISVQFAQGVGAAKYALKDGSALPEGLELSEDGIISGTPEAAGNYTFTLVASGNGVVGDEVTVTLFVAGEIADGGCGSAVGTSYWFITALLFLASAVIVACICRKNNLKN